MRKNKKLIKIIAITLIIIVSAGIWAGTNIFGVTLYDMDAENILDNLSREGDQVVIPIIYKEPDAPITAERIKADFKKKGLTIKNISTDVIGTGTQITTNENRITYNIMIYGDTNGDGEVDLVDAQKIILHVRYPDTKSLKGIYLTAANVSREDDEIDLVDAQRIILFLRYSKTLMSELPRINQADIEKPTIYVKGSTRETVEIGSEYVDKGATAEDDFDGNIESKIVTTGTVDTSKVGTYTIKYDVTDSAGNKAETKTRTVTVVDVIQRIIPKTQQTKKVYNYGENIDLKDAEITVIWKSGKEETMNDTSKLTVLNYNPKSPGEQSIGIQYKTFRINDFSNVIVKNKIDTIAVDTAYKANATVADPGGVIPSESDIEIKVQTNKEFTIGKVVGVGEDLSTLNLSKLSVSVTSDNKNDVASIAITNEGLLTGKIKPQKPGNYTVAVKYVNENNENITWTKTIVAETNNIINSFALSSITDYKIRQSNENPEYSTFTFYNENGEEIDNSDQRDNPIEADDVTIKNENADVTVKVCNSANMPVDEATDKIVKKISIRTTCVTEKTVTIYITIGDVVEQPYTFKIGKLAEISGIEGRTKDIPSDITVTDGETTTIPLSIIDQYDQDIPIIYSQIYTAMNIDDEATSLADFQAEAGAVLGIAARWPINTIRKFEGTTVSAGSANPITHLGFEFEEGYDETQDFEDLYHENKQELKEALEGQVNIILYLKVGTEIYKYPITTSININ